MNRLTWLELAGRLLLCLVAAGVAGWALVGMPGPVLRFVLL